MRDPERLTSSNGLSELEREMLEAGKNEAMPAALREQMERALGLSGAPAAGGQVRARVEAATGVKASAIVWISAGVVVLGVVGGLIGSLAGARLGPARVVAPAVAPAAIEPPAPPPGAAASSAGASRVAALLPAPAGLEVVPGGASIAPVALPARRAGALAAAPLRAHSHSRSHAALARAGIARAASTGRGHAASASSSAAERVAPAESVSAAVDAPIAEAPSRAPAAADQQKPSANRSAPARAAAVPPGDLRAEIDLIDGARAALRAGDMAEAMALLGKHAVHFPHGALAPEETALRVEALMRMGRTAEARAYARRFVAANPASPLADRMRRLVNGDTAP